MHYLALFSILFKKLTKHALFIARLYENDNLLGKFEKIFENCKKCIIFSIFFNKFNQTFVTLFHVWTEKTIPWKF